jgi:hypothetical protein
MHQRKLPINLADLRRIASPQPSRRFLNRHVEDRVVLWVQQIDESFDVFVIVHDKTFRESGGATTLLFEALDIILFQGVQPVRTISSDNVPERSVLDNDASEIRTRVSVSTKWLMIRKRNGWRGQTERFKVQKSPSAGMFFDSAPTPGGMQGVSHRRAERVIEHLRVFFRQLPT